VTNWRPRAVSPALLAVAIIVGLALIGSIVLIGLNLRGGDPATTSSPGLPTPRTSISPGSSPTIQPTTDPDGSPTPPLLTPPPTPAGSLTPEQAMLLHVPEPVRSTCTVAPGRRAVLLVATCTVDAGALTVNYFEYDGPESMADAYAVLVGNSQIERSTGRCEDPVTWPAESEYRVGGEITGRRLCTNQPGAPTIYWTDDRLTILGQVAGQADGYDRLIDFWTNESGPIP
jgi:hypothetical protein